MTGSRSTGPPLRGPIVPPSASATRQLMAPAPAARSRRRLLPPSSDRRAGNASSVAYATIFGNSDGGKTPSARCWVARAWEARLTKRESLVSKKAVSSTLRESVSTSIDAGNSDSDGVCSALPRRPSPPGIRGVTTDYRQRRPASLIEATARSTRSLSRARPFRPGLPASSAAGSGGLGLKQSRRRRVAGPGNPRLIRNEARLEPGIALFCPRVHHSR
jgi:hypothetical protein